MIAHLRGRLLEKHPNRVIVDVNGVGYDVHVPLSTFYEMAEPDEEIALRIHTHVREDALLLYGFATGLELQIFERLISVSGIGPKLALAVLSGIEPNELVSAIRTANVARLTGIPGIGKKIAERIGLELKDKMASFLPAEVAASPTAATGETLRTDVLSALMNLGYHRPLAERAVDSALKKSAGSSFESTLKHALRELAK
jgi:Holliday junction DNA helicase RuvA